MTESLPLALWNGALMPLSEVKVPATDRAFLFGDAVYEVVRIYAGRPWLLVEHAARLARSLGELRIGADIDLGAACARLVEVSGVLEGVVYLQVSRGEAPRKHVPPEGMRPNVLAWIDRFDEEAACHRQWAHGARAVTLPDRRWGRCDIKSTNLLWNTLAATEAKRAGADEAILVNAAGELTEGAHTSVVCVIGGVLRTHPDGHAILPGTTRERVFGLAAGAGLRIERRPVGLAELRAAGADLEVFLTATSSEIVPIVGLDGAAVGTGRPGPVTRRLQRLYAEALPGRRREFLSS